MCEVLRTLVKDEINREKKETAEKVTFDINLNITKKTMKNQEQSAEEAMRVLEFPESEQNSYLAELHPCSENGKKSLLATR